MSEPTIHRFWTTTTSGTSSYSRYVDCVEKSDYDELKAKLTDAERLNRAALEAMKMHARNEFGSDDAITDAIKEIEGTMK